MNNKTSQAKSKSRITRAQALALLKKNSPMDAEDKKDGGRDEALEDAQGNLKKSSPIPALDAEDAADASSGGAEEVAENSGKLKFGSPEWRAKYGRGKSKTVADALSAPMKASK